MTSPGVRTAVDWITALLVRGAGAGAAQVLLWGVIGMAVDGSIGPDPVSTLAMLVLMGGLAGMVVGGLVGLVTAPVMATRAAGRPAVRAAVTLVPAAVWVVATLVAARGLTGGRSVPGLLVVLGFWHVGPAVWIGLVLRRLTRRPPGTRRPAF